MVRTGGIECRSEVIVADSTLHKSGVLQSMRGVVQIGFFVLLSDVSYERARAEGHISHFGNRNRFFRSQLLKVQGIG